MAVSIDAAIVSLQQQIEAYALAVARYERAETGATSQTLKDARRQIALAIDELVAATIEASTEHESS